jgi:ParB family transcriptional regulator, chromosome partitioning protein
VHSIQTYGFRGAIWLQKLPGESVRLIAGETRLDAAIAAGLTEITADIITTDDERLSFPGLKTSVGAISMP